MTPAHQFPMGTILPIADRVHLLNRIANEDGKYLVEDDYDSEFRYKGQPIPALKSMDYGDRVIYMGSFSKSLSPALRISYMVLPDCLFRRYKDKVKDTGCPVSVPIQHVVERFITEGFFERHLNRMRTVYRKRREAVLDAVRKEAKTRNLPWYCTGADAGLYVLLHLPKGVSATSCVNQAIEVGVRVEGVQSYERDRNSTDRILILGFSRLKEEEVADAVHTLATLVERQNPERRKFEK